MFEWLRTNGAYAWLFGSRNTVREPEVKVPKTPTDLSALTTPEQYDKLMRMIVDFGLSALSMRYIRDSHDPALPDLEHKLALTKRLQIGYMNMAAELLSRENYDSSRLSSLRDHIIQTVIPDAENYKSTVEDELDLRELREHLAMLNDIVEMINRALSGKA